MTKEWNYFLTHSRELGKKYAGKCVAIVDDKVVAVGPNRMEVYRVAIKDIPKSKKVGIFYFPLREEILSAL